MKKRMLITTIVMMLVLAVALTTSSLAWFSASQATVTASGGQFTASAQDSAANIGVANDKDATNWKSTSPMQVVNAANLKPLCAIAELPNNLNADLGESKKLADIDSVPTLNGANFTNDGRQWFPLNEANPVYTNTLASQAHHVIYAQNLDNNGTNVSSLKVKLTIEEITPKAEGDSAAAPNFFIVLTATDADSSVLRTAVISKADGYVVFNFSDSGVTSTEDNPLLVSAVESNRKTTYGESLSLPTIQNAVDQYAEVNFTGLTWAPGTIYAIHVYAWYEGGTLDVTTDGCQHKYSLELSADIA